MKHILSTSALLLLAASIQAQNINYINADGSAAGELCIATLESRHAVMQKAAELQINNFRYEQLSCNNLSVYQWTRQQATAAPAVTSDRQVSFAVGPADNTAETELCVAAATSPNDFERLKKSYTGPVENLRCNGTQVKQFMQRYSMLD